VVVTHHDTNPGLFNTKFRLKFGRQVLPDAATNQNISDETLNTIMIGRSSSCAMVLDYRTVSTTHAKITFSVRKTR
jgi:pSer/pThr/pTyr-binding forkhead associated (FHA) protein